MIIYISINPPKDNVIFLTFTERLVALESALRKRLTNSAGYKYRLRVFILRVLEPWDDPDQAVYDQVYLDRIVIYKRY